MSRALVLLGHGSHLDANSSAAVRAHAERIRAMGVFDAVRAAFWKEEPSLARAFDGLAADEIVAVPVFISSGYFTETVIPRELGLDGPLTERGGTVIRYTPPIGAAPVLASVIEQRAIEAGAEPGDAIAVLGHGTPRNPNSERNVYLQAESLAARGRFAEVVTVFLDQEPHMSKVLERTTAERVIVVPLFIADGWHVGESIPADLALEGPETRRDGRVLRYAKAAGTHPAVADVILELAGGGGVAGGGGAPVPAWLSAAFAARAPFVLGELAVTFDDAGAVVRVSGGGREIDPTAVRATVRVDAAGRYRPLSGEFGLPGGWWVRSVDPRELGEVLETVYPLAAVHVAQEAAGTLRVVELEAVLGRQSGRYGGVAGATPEQRDAAISAVCGRCVRVPRWGAGVSGVREGVVIPCPEPCGILVEDIRERVAEGRTGKGAVREG